MSSPIFIYFLADGEIWVSNDIQKYPPVPQYPDVSPGLPGTIDAIFKISGEVKYQQLGTIVGQILISFNDAVGTELGAAAPYGILAAAGITNASAATTIVPNPPVVIGSFPTTSITGFNPPLATIDNTDAAAAQAAALVAYNYYSSLTFTSLGGSIDLSTSNGSGGNVYTPGNYSFGAALMSTGIVLNGAGTYIFKGSSTINLASGQSIIPTNGATASNVVWLVGSSLTTVANSNFVGTILANTSITLGGGTLVGRALAGVVTSSGAVTIAASTAITLPEATGAANAVGTLQNVGINNAATLVTRYGLTGGNGRNGIEIV